MEGDHSAYFLLTQSPRYIELGNGKSADVSGKLVQRLLQEATADSPAQLDLAWEEDGFFFTLSGVLKGSLSEQVLHSILLSVKIR